MPGESRTARIAQTRSMDVPRELHDRAWAVYDVLGHGQQSADRILERGGFSWGEVALMLGGFDPWTGQQGDLSDCRRMRPQQWRAVLARWEEMDAAQ